MSDWSSDVCSSDRDRQRATARPARSDSRTDERLERHQRDDGCRRARDGQARQRERPRLRHAGGRSGQDSLQPQRRRRGFLWAAAQWRHPVGIAFGRRAGGDRSEEHTSELQSLMRISYAVFCLKKKTVKIKQNITIELEIKL